MVELDNSAFKLRRYENASQAIMCAFFRSVGSCIAPPQHCTTDALWDLQNKALSQDAEERAEASAQGCACLGDEPESPLSKLAAFLLAAVIFGALSVQTLHARGLTHLLRSAHSLLTSAAQIHELPASLANHAKVQFVGTVTYYDPLEQNLFVQDASGGVFIRATKRYALQVGDKVMVKGEASPSYRTEVSGDADISVISHGQRMAAVPVSYEQLASGGMDCRLVRLRGKVRSVNVEQHDGSFILHLDVTLHNGTVQVYQPTPAIKPDQRERFSTKEALPLLDSIVEVEGVAGGEFDTKSQLTGVIIYTQQRSDIRILRKPLVNALELPLSDIDRIFESRRVDDSSNRLRIRGTLTYYKKGESAVLEGNGKSVFIQTREDKDIPLGNVVDAVGFASDQQYAPSLRQAILFDTHTQGKVEPRAISYLDALSGIASDNLVSLDGLLVSQLRDGNVETLVIDSDGSFVTARLEHTGTPGKIHIGTRLRITGICRVVPGGSWKVPSYFLIEMRTPADVVTLSSPSWLTIRHLIELLSTLAILIMTVVGWAVLLRRRVREQTESIAHSMIIAKARSSLLESINFHRSTGFLLNEFCEKVRILLPGMDCSFVLEGESTEQLLLPAPETARTLLYTGSLRNSEAQEIGHIQVFGLKPKSFGRNQQEVCFMLTEAANLALQRCILYQGLVHHSTHDPLTDLPNRRLCEERLQEALKQAAETHGRVTVAYIDVDRFKEINDRYGHRTGDTYLKHISARLRSAIRSIDTLARVGGDEFLVIVPQKRSDADFISLQERLQGCFQQPFEIEGHQFQGAASLGLASYPEHGNTAEELKRHADQAMYIAKRKASSAEGLGQTAKFSIFTPNELELAFERNQLSLSYQPQFSADGRLQGLEALLRLHDPILGIITPDAFISAAERCEIILHLGRWVLESAVQSAISWGLHEGPPVLMSVNVAPLQIAEPDFAETVLSIIERHGFPADRLELELTERSFGIDSYEEIRQVQRLRDAGVRIAIDDFGTGYSALSLLHRLPIDTIKIDRSFIMAMEKEPSVVTIIEAIAFMAGSLGKRIVAEGVETSSSMAKLRQMGRMDYQGYLMSRPVDSNKVKHALREWRAGIALPMPMNQKAS